MRAVRNLHFCVWHRWSIAACCAVGTHASGGPYGLAFTEISLQAGIFAGFQPPNGVFVSSMIAGVAVADFNNDGRADIYVLSGGGTTDRLFIGTGLNSQGVPRFENRAAAWGVDLLHIGAGVSVVDFDNDGWPDLYVTAHGDSASLRPGRHRLLRNNGSAEPGVAGFTDVTQAAGLAFTSPQIADGFGSSWADVDGDGHLDLFVAGWVSNSNGNRLFLNNGDGTFRDATQSHIPAGLSGVFGFMPRLEDINSDGHPDLLLAADFFTSRLMVNDGTGRFDDVTALSGTGLDSNGMGATTDDFNNDGLVDWYVTSIYQPGFPGRDGNKLYLNNGDGTFAERAAQLGVARGGWGWGAASGDLNLNGHIDIVETNGWSGATFLNEQSYVFVNNGDGASFSEVAQQTNLFHTGQGRGVVLFDADNDGDLDVIIVSNNLPLRLYRNQAAANTGRFWIRLRFYTRDAPSVPPMGVGTRVALTAWGRTMWRTVQANSNYLSQGPIEAHFGLGQADAIELIEIHWPNGTTRVMRDVEPNRVHTLTACAADMDGDHDTTAADMGAFLSYFHGAERPADINADRRIDFFDLAAFVNAYRRGCPPDA